MSRHPFTRTCLASALAAVVLAAMLPTSARAATYYWKGSHGTSNYADTSNWTINNGTLPGVGDIADFNNNFSGTYQPQLRQNLLQLGALYMESGATKAVTFSNQASFVLSLAGSLTVDGNANAGIVMENNSNSFTIQANLALLNSQQWVNSGSQPLAIAGTVDTGSYVLTLSGSGAGGITFNSSGVINDSGGLNVNMTGAGLATLSAANTYTGGTTVNVGTLKLDFTAAGARPATFFQRGHADPRRRRRDGHHRQCQYHR